MAKGRIDSLDSLRGLAALSVVIFHALISFIIFYEGNYNQIYENNFVRILSESPLKIIWGGTEGVLLFFVLSGFVLTYLFSKEKKVKYVPYITKRFFRIYVPYALVMIISIIIAMLFLEYKDVSNLSPVYDRRWDHEVSLLAIASYILMLNYDTPNVNGVVWTLFHEMRISIIFPLIAWIVLKFNFKKSIWLSLIFSFGFMQILYILGGLIGSNTIGSVVDNFGDTFYYTFYFFLGAFLCKYRDSIIEYFKMKQTTLKFTIFVIALLLIANKWMYSFVDLSSYRLGEIISGLGIVLLFIVVFTSKLTDKILTLSPLLWLGKISYSLYLIHIPVMMITTVFLSKVISIELSFVIAIILSIPAAYLCYKFIEIPSINLSKKVGQDKKMNKKTNEESF